MNVFPKEMRNQYNNVLAKSVYILFINVLLIYIFNVPFTIFGIASAVLNTRVDDKHYEEIPSSIEIS